MSSNPTAANPQTFTAEDNLIRAVMHDVESREATAQKPIIISIIGGSASGKTTVAKDLATQIGPVAGILSQDLFQFGSDFANKKTSRYKWDDPDNFDLQNCAQALAKLKSNQRATVPNYDVVANIRLGTTDIQPKPVIIWEGIYAALTPELRELSDIIIYIDVPYIVRFVRRIARFLLRTEIHDMTVPGRHMLSFVSWADIDYVSTQKKFAGYTLAYDPDGAMKDVANLHEKAALHPVEWSSAHGQPLKRAALADITLELYNDGFAIRTMDDAILYAIPLDKEITQEASSYWDRLLHF